MTTSKNPRTIKSAGEPKNIASIPLQAPQTPAFDTSKVHPHPDAEFEHSALRAIAQLARYGTQFTTDDVRAMGVPEPNSPSRWGVVMQAAHRAGTIRPVAATNSRRPVRHGGLQRVWEGVPVSKEATE